MIEMMVAIVILGLGLLMAATMFPVGWTRARDLAEFTTETTAAENAAATVRLLCNVSNPSAGIPTSFLGDFDQAVFDAGTTNPWDSEVHVLHVENALADAASVAARPDRNPILPGWYESETDLLNVQPTDWIGNDPRLGDWVNVGAAPGAQIAFRERVVPPLAARPDGSVDPDGLARWDAMLDARRFAWAVLYRIENAASITPADPRSIDFYLVTLRRTQLNHRFARQDPNVTNPTTQPQALDLDEDMLFPVPWLVNLRVAGRWDADGDPPGDFFNEAEAPPEGVPSEAVANPGGAAAGQLIAQMLQTGSILIDRLNGNVYTVKSHRFTGDDADFDHEATVTLDREITVADVDTDWTADGGPALNDRADLTSPYDEASRDFCVFPPPVLAERPASGFVLFDGRQPVVGLEVRQMFFSP